MQWSKIKSRAESFICPELKGSVEYFSTSYRSSGQDRIGRACVLVDGVEVFEADTWKMLLHDGEFEHIDFVYALKEYANLPISEAFSSDNPIVRGLSMIDRRLGKRRLESVGISEDEHEFVKFMRNLRKGGV